MDVYVFNFLCFVVTVAVFGFVVVKAGQKYLSRRNLIAKWLFFALFFYLMSLVMVMINTLIEYIFVLYPVQWWHSWFYWQYVLMLGLIRDSMIMLSSLFIALFYAEVFIKEKSKKTQHLLLIYAAITLILAVLFVFGMYYIDYHQYYLESDWPVFIFQLSRREVKLVILLLHTLVVYVPFILQSLILRARLKKEDAVGNAEYIRKFSYILGLGLSLLGLFFFSLLDTLSGTEFSIWYYGTFVSEIAAALFAYYGFIREVKA